MMKDTPEGQTHSFNDGCGDPAHNFIEDFDKKIGMMRQWLNEDRITDSKKMVTNEELKHWFK